MKQVGTRQEVYSGMAVSTKSGYTKKDLKKNNVTGKIVPKRSRKGGALFPGPTPSPYDNIVPYYMPPVGGAMHNFIRTLDMSGSGIGGGKFWEKVKKGLSTVKKIAQKVGKFLTSKDADDIVNVAGRILSQMPSPKAQAIAASLPAVKQIVTKAAEVAGKIPIGSGVTVPGGNMQLGYPKSYYGGKKMGGALALI